MKFRPALAVFGTVITLSSAAAQAIEFVRPLPEKSSLSFVSRQMNVPVEGRFKNFRSQIAFDPAKPAAASADIEIDLASIDTGSKEANDEVVGKSWFNTRSFPTARFTSTAVRALGGDRYEVAGRISIKGKTQDLVAPVSVRRDGNTAVFEGSLTIRRSDFALGEGMWADFSTVANEVQIKFRIAAAGR